MYPSPAQMLVPSTVVSSCKGDSSGPKNSSMFKILFLGPFTCCGGVSETFFGSGNLSKEIRILAVGHMTGVVAAGNQDIPGKWDREQCFSSPRIGDDDIHQFHGRFKCGGGASWRSPLKWYRPSSSDFSAGMGRLSSSVPR